MKKIKCQTVRHEVPGNYVREHVIHQFVKEIVDKYMETSEVEVLDRLFEDQKGTLYQLEAFVMTLGEWKAIQSLIPMGHRETLEKILDEKL